MSAVGCRVYALTVNDVQLSHVHRRRQEFVLGGVTTKAPKAPRSRRRRRRGEGNREGCSLPNRLGGLAEPVENEFLSIYNLELEKTHLIATNLEIVIGYLTFPRHIHTYKLLLNSKRKTFTFVPFAQLKRLCNFFLLLWGRERGLGPQLPPLSTPMVTYASGDSNVYKKVVLSQGEPYDTAGNIDT